MRSAKIMTLWLVILALAIISIGLSGGTVQAGSCGTTPVIKSIWPALVELDPYTLRVKDRDSFWEINKSTASPYGDYAWGLSGLPTEDGPDIYFLHSINNFTGNTNIYRMNMDTGKSSQYLPLTVRASGLAQKGNQFYIAYYERQNVVQRVGGEKIILPEIIGAIDHVSDPSGDYLLAITGKLGSQKVFKIPLDGSGNLVGTFSLAVTIQADFSSPLYPYAYTGITHARMPWDGGEREVIFVSKDSGNYEPWDVVALVDLETGYVFNTMIATDSGITVNPPIKWPNGITSDYLSWANPQGLQYIEDVDEEGNCVGRLFMVTRFYWNKGPICVYLPDIDIEKYVSVDHGITWYDADSPTGPTTIAGNPVYFRFVVTNTGNVPLMNIVLNDTDFALNGCSIPSSLDPNAFFECIVGPVTAVQGQHVNTATVTGQYNSLPAVSDSDSAYYYGIPGTPRIHIEKSGPVFGYSGDPITYTYTVTNTGDVPLANVIVTDDKCGQASYVSGDVNGNSLLDLSETWIFTCTCSPSFTFPNALVNTATATGSYGSQTVQDQDDYTLYPFVLRKKIFLYWDSPARTIEYPLPDSTLFSVLMKKDGVDLDSFTISQTSEKKIWLSWGTYEFCESNLPSGYLPGYSCISYTTGQGYPDWTFPNVITFDLAIEKAGPEEACIGETVTYTYVVTNAGPASVVPSVLDDKCGSPTYTGGDTNSNGYVDAGETWTYTCDYQIPMDDGTPVRTIVDTVVNTVVVSDANAPSSGGWILGGDRNTANNTDTWSLSVEPCTFTGQVCGTKFDDENANGRRDEGEGVISGVGITLFSGSLTMGDFVDVGDENSEVGHNLEGWGPIEPDTHGGGWGGIATDSSSPDRKTRVAWFKPASGTDLRSATFTLNAGTSSENLLKLKVLDSVGDDSFAVYVNDNLIYSYMGKNNPASGGYNLFGDAAGTGEAWHTHQLYVPYSGQIKITVVSTAPAWTYFDTYGQLAVDWAELSALTKYEIPGNPTLTGEDGTFCFSVPNLGEKQTSAFYAGETSLPAGTTATTPTVLGPIQLTKDTPSSQGNNFGNTQIITSIDVEKYVSVNNQGTWLDADTAPGPGASVGADVYFKFVVTNTGSFPLTNITLSDSDFDLSSCSIKDPLFSGESFECVIGPFPAIEGQHTNTATATGDFDTQTVTVSDDANYFGQQGQAGTTLTANKTATGTWNRTFSWTIDKSATPETLNLFRGDTGSSQYTVGVTKDSGVDEAYIEGQICVTNGGAKATENLQIVDELRDGVPPPNDLIATINIDVSSNPVLDPGETACYSYRIDVPAGAIHSGTYKNTANVTITNHSGHLGDPFGPSPSATTTLPEVPTTEYGSITVDDTNGHSWTFNASGSQIYSKDFTCDADAGVHQNTATIRGTSQSDNASVTVNCHSLTVTKNAATSFKRTYQWTIDKQADKADIPLGLGEIATVNYDVVLDATFTDGDRAAAGNIWISNPAPMAATVTGVSDMVSPDIAATVNCGVSFPYLLNAGGTLQCSYTASLPDASARTNTATAVLQNIPTGTTNFSGSANVDFGGAAMTEIDKTITVTDTLHGDLGSVTYGVDTLPKTFSYSQTIGPYSSSGDYTVVNTAPFVTNDTKTTGSDTWTVTVHVELLFSAGDFCTYTQGGWGSRPSGQNPGSILSNNFDDVYDEQGYVQVGYTGTGGKYIRFTGAPFVDRYLPAGGTPDKLTITFTNPTTTASGVFGGQVLALQLNVDFNGEGIIDGADGAVGDLSLCNTGTSLDGKTVNEILAAANVALGGGARPTGYTYSSLNDLVTHLNEAFDNCNVSTWALEHLCR